LCNTITHFKGYQFWPTNQAIIRPMYCEEPCKIHTKVHGIEIMFPIQICRKNTLKYEVKLDKNKKYYFKKKYSEKFKFFFIRHTAVPAVNIGNDILHGDPLFLAITIHSVYQTLHGFPTTVNIFLVSAVDFGVYVVETSTLAEGHCSSKTDNSWYLVCEPYPTPLPTAFFDYLQPISQPSLGLSLKLNVLWEVI